MENIDTSVLAANGLNAPTVLVLGGRGFIGRYVVASLKEKRVRVLVGTRQAFEPMFEGAGAQQRCVRLHRCLKPEHWRTVLSGVDAVINSVGILRERDDESFDAVHNQAVKALAEACKLEDIPLVHVSALGIDAGVTSEFALSKLRGERAIAASGCTATILRASVVDAVDGYGSGWFRKVAQWPVYLLPEKAQCLLSPVAAEDLGEALVRLALGYITDDSSRGTTRLLEVGCGENMTLGDYLLRLRKPGWMLGLKPIATLTVPDWLARVSARLFDFLHLTPYSIGHHELLQFDNIPVKNALPELLGRKPTRIGPTAGDSLLNSGNLPRAGAKF